MKVDAMLDLFGNKLEPERMAYAGAAVAIAGRDGILDAILPTFGKWLHFYVAHPFRGFTTAPPASLAPISSAPICATRPEVHAELASHVFEMLALDRPVPKRARTQRRQRSHHLPIPEHDDKRRDFYPTC
jgi:hypothetical protein